MVQDQGLCTLPNASLDILLLSKLTWKCRNLSYLEGCLTKTESCKAARDSGRLYQSRRLDNRS